MDSVMPHPALGGYFKTLRAQQGLTQSRVLRQLHDKYNIDIDRSTLYRAENGRNWPEGDLLTALLDLLGGRHHDLVWIQQHQSATEIDGIAMAEAWLKERGPYSSIEELKATRDREDIAEVVADLEDLLRKLRGVRE